MEPPDNHVDWSKPNFRMMLGVACHVGLAAGAVWLGRRQSWPQWQEAVFYGVMTSQSLVLAAWVGLGAAQHERLTFAGALLAMLTIAFAFNTLSDYGSMRAFNSEPMMMDQLFRSLTPAGVMACILFLQRKRGVWLVSNDGQQDEGTPFQISTRDLFVATFVAAVLLGVGRLLAQFPDFAKMLVLPVCLVVLGLHIMWISLAPRFDLFSVILGLVTFVIVAVTPVFWLRYPVVAWPLLTTVVVVVLGIQLAYWRFRGLRLISK